MPAKRKWLNIDLTQDNLVIVESPAKAKTIKKYLGPWFEVVASMWHIRDLPKKNAIDIKHNYATTYEISPDKKAVVSSLKKAAKHIDNIWIATDEDREWEAIWRHLCEAMWLDPSVTKRIVFHEITQEAIQKAVASPRTVDLDLVNAQQARRVLDRLVWFDLSPVLRKKVKTGLSAGRVQSVAVRLLVERERDIMNFNSQYSFKTKWIFHTKTKEIFEWDLNTIFVDQKEVKLFLESCKEAEFTVSKVDITPGTKTPWAPLTTSSLQQQASTRYWYPVARTMQLAQRLYESWHITYMRTDSTNLSAQSLAACKKHITSKYGSEYHHQRTFKSKSKGAQEAHEAIRPTNISQEIAWDDADQKKIYRLIRERTVASQMAVAKTNKTKAEISISNSVEKFIAKWEVVTFEWYLAAIDKKFDDSLLPDIQSWDVLMPSSITSLQVASKAPARFTEASLVKKLEELGIWRPSTYAPTINTIQKRGYVQKGISEGTLTDFKQFVLVDKSINESLVSKKVGSNRGKLVPTDVGMVVTDFLLEHFDQIMDYQFTAEVEAQFDIIASGKLVWFNMIDKFYTPFHKLVEEVTDNAERASWERILWNHPENWKIVKVRVWRYWPLAQIWESDDEDVKFASLRGGHRMETINMEDALELFALPRTLWQWEWKDLKASIGRFGPYIQYWTVFASLKEDDPYTIDFDTAVILMTEKLEKEAAALLKEFDYEDKPWIVKMWRRWPFIKRNRLNIRLPKWVDGADISQDEIEKYIQDQKTTKKKAAKKKPKRKAKKKLVKKKVTKK